jgi:hypothetical protein
MTKTENPFTQISTPSHARLLAQCFVAMHVHDQLSDADLDQQLRANLRLASLIRGEQISSYLDGRHFLSWQNGRSEFEATVDTCAELQDLARAFLESW